MSIVRFTVALMLWAGVLHAIAWRTPPPYVVAPRLRAPPVVDGRLDEWLHAPLEIGPQSHLLTSRAHYSGSADLSARIWFAWDDTSLYAAGEVRDDVVTEGEAWDRDRINLVFDWREDTTPLTYAVRSPDLASWQSDDYWVFFQPFWGAGRPGAVKRFDRQGQARLADARVASRRTPGGYTFEVRLPSAALPEYAPFVAHVAGLQVFISDGDGSDPLTELMWSDSWGHDPSSGLVWELWRTGRLVFADAR